MRTIVLAIGLVLIFARLTLACVPSPPPLEPLEGRASVVLLSFSVQAAAMQCTANARHLARVDVARADELVASCVRHLVPARDAVTFAPADVDPWTTSSASSAGCMAKAVRLGLEGVRADFLSAGYSGPLPAMMLDGLRTSSRIEVYANEACDPLHPTTRRSLFVDPRIAPVEPDYPR